MDSRAPNLKSSIASLNANRYLYISGNFHFNFCVSFNLNFWIFFSVSEQRDRAAWLMRPNDSLLDTVADNLLDRLEVSIKFLYVSSFLVLLCIVIVVVISFFAVNCKSKVLQKLSWYELVIDHSAFINVDHSAFINVE